MMIYIALLQGINVGKHNRIKMTDLKHMFESRGLKNVQTYGQSGNVLFESEKDELYIRKMIEKEIMIIFKYVVPVVLRTSEEMEQVILNCPFSKEKIRKAELATGESTYVSFLKQVPSPEKVEIIKPYNDEGDEFQIIGRDVYLLFLHQSIRNSKLGRNLIKLDIHATVRNWNTVMKLNVLAKNMLLK
ncbi:DUF1697 domain-containing protein [Mycoplasmatota bacterium]|nr:DUF1697 domain-containing protein [Mycoplasmatota bacterium]